MKVAVLTNGIEIIVVGLGKDGQPMDNDGTLFGPESGRDIQEFQWINLDPSTGTPVIITINANQPTC